MLRMLPLLPPFGRLHYPLWVASGCSASGEFFDQLRPRFKIDEFRIQEAPLRSGVKYVQIAPRCLTNAPMSECQGNLLQICKWYIDESDVGVIRNERIPASRVMGISEVK